jgi:hypothetical protein
LNLCRLKDSLVSVPLGPANDHSIIDSFVFVTITLSVLVVELTLLWNSVTGVYDISSVGQLIPLAIGIGTLGQVLWRRIEKRHEVNLRSPFLSVPLFYHCVSQ